MSSHVLLNLINKVEKRDKDPRVAKHFITSINSIIQEHNC